MVDAGQIHLIEELRQIGIEAVTSGLVVASGGNLSARMPGATDFVITNSGTWLNRLSPNDFTVMDTEGDIVETTHKPSSEWKLHQRIYRDHPEVNCVIHLHPQQSVLLDALGIPIRFFTLDDALYVKSIGHVDYYPNGSDELADFASAQVAEHNCVVLAHHGCSVVADTTEMAYRRALLMELAADNTYRATVLGDTDTAFPLGVELTHA